jgi:hypothetical protein
MFSHVDVFARQKVDVCQKDERSVNAGEGYIAKVVHRIETLEGKNDPCEILHWLKVLLVDSPWIRSRTSEARTVDSSYAIFGRTWTLTCWRGASFISEAPLRIVFYLGSVKFHFSLKCTIGELESLLAL